METMTPMDFMKFRSVTYELLRIWDSALMPVIWRKPVQSGKVTPPPPLPAEPTLVRVYMGKKLTPLPEPTALAHALIIRDIKIQRGS